MTDIFPLTISVAEAVRMVGLGRTSLYAAIATGKLNTRKAGRRTLIEVAELKRFVSTLPPSGGNSDAA